MMNDFIHFFFSCKPETTSHSSLSASLSQQRKRKASRPNVCALMSANQFLEKKKIWTLIWLESPEVIMKRNPPRSFPSANWNACRSNKYTHSSKQSRSQWKISISIIGLHTVIHECDVSELLTNWNWYLRWYLTSLFTLEIWKINIIVSGRTYGGIEFHEWARFSSLSLSATERSVSVFALMDDRFGVYDYDTDDNVVSWNISWQLELSFCFIRRFEGHVLA